MSKECHPLLVSFVPVVELLGAMLGREYEVVLHDVSRGDAVIVALFNGELTGRDYNAPMTDFGNFLITSPESANIEFIANYPSEAENGRAMRSGVSLIRDESRKLIGFLCINYDMTKASILKDMGNFLMRTRSLSFDSLKTEKFGGVKDEQSLMEKARQKFSKPLSYLSSEERKQCIRYMDEIGFFKLKGSVERLAKEMGKSRYTLYADIRASRKEK